MIILKTIGYWWSEFEQDLPSPSKHVGPYSPEEKQRIVSYLQGGDTVHQYRGSSSCRICGCRNGSTEYTDGEYIWPSGLTHYIEDHDVLLPLEFVEATKGDLDLKLKNWRGIVHFTSDLTYWLDQYKPS